MIQYLFSCDGGRTCSGVWNEPVRTAAQTIRSDSRMMPAHHRFTTVKHKYTVLQIVK